MQISLITTSLCIYLTVSLYQLRLTVKDLENLIRLQNELKVGKEKPKEDDDMVL